MKVTVSAQDGKLSAMSIKQFSSSLSYEFDVLEQLEIW